MYILQWSILFFCCKYINVLSYVTVTTLEIKYSIQVFVVIIFIIAFETANG